MKLPHALGLIAVSSCLSAGCAGTGASRLAGVSPLGGGGRAGGAFASASSRGDIEARAGGMMSGRVMRDDIRVNEPTSFADRDPQFAGPTPQVPIPCDGRSGQPTLW